MIPYVGCHQARELLGPFVDGELPVADQVAVESHLRWCRVCCAHVEDIRLIGSTLRVNPHSQAEDSQALAAINARALARIGAERAEPLGVRLRELFVDMRLLWPALGATVAVLICISVAFGVLWRAAQERPESLAAMIRTLGQPGSERNPLRPDGGISIPRVIDDGSMLEGMPQEDAVFAFSTVVSREGRITNYELLRSAGAGSNRQDAAHADHVQAVLDAVKHSRFAPAQTPMGRAVAVNIVWLIVVTTAEEPAETPPVDVAPIARRRRRDVPPAATGEVLPLPPSERRSATPRTSTTA